MSWPGTSARRVFARMTRPSTPYFLSSEDVDARDKPGHDGERKTKGRERSRPFFIFVIARSVATKQSSFLLRQDGLLRCARNDVERALLIPPPASRRASDNPYIPSRHHHRTSPCRTGSA